MRASNFWASTHSEHCTLCVCGRCGGKPSEKSPFGNLGWELTNNLDVPDLYCSRCLSRIPCDQIPKENDQ